MRAADRSPGREGHRYPVHVARGYILIELDRLAEARSTLEAGRRIGEELGLGWHQGSYHVPGIVQHFVAGQWDEAIAEVEASIELAAGTGESFGLLVGRSVLALISLHRNDVRRAEEAAAAAVGQYSEHRHHPLPLAVGAVGPGPHAGGGGRTAAGLRDAGRLLGPVRRARPRAGVPDARGRSRAAGPGLRGRGTGAGGDGPRRRARRAEPRRRLAGRGGPALPGPAGRRRRGAARRGRRLRRRIAAARAGAHRRGGGGGLRPAGPARRRPGRCWIRRPRSTSASARRATWPGPRRCCAGRVSAVAAGAAAAGRSSAGTASPRPSARSRAWWRRGCRIPRSATGCTYRTGRCRPTSPTSSPSSTSPRAPSGCRGGPAGKRVSPISAKWPMFSPRR